MDVGTGLSSPECFYLSAAAGWLELGNVTEARVELERLSAHREHPDVMEIQWKVFAEEKDWPSALATAEKAVAISADRASAWISYAYALHELKRTPEAFESLQRVVETFPEQYVIPYNLACYQCQMGNKPETMKWLRRAAAAADPRTIRAMALKDPDLAPVRDQVQRLV